MNPESLQSATTSQQAVENLREPGRGRGLILEGDFSFHRPKGTGRLVDIGCNEGRGLKIYSRNGFQAEGLELNGTILWLGNLLGRGDCLVVMARKT